MYWLLDDARKQQVRETVEGLVNEISEITTRSQADQLFPFVGRKDLSKASAVIRWLSEPGDTVVDPFSGSAIFSYAAASMNRFVISNEWEPYTWRISSAPWRLPEEKVLKNALDDYLSSVKPHLDELYQTRCNCGHLHVLDSLFFDRVPLAYKDVQPHERLGKDGRTVIYRGRYKCPKCKSTEKFFDTEDEAHLRTLNQMPLSAFAKKVFSSNLIENSRINLSSAFTTYGSLFPHRSKLAFSFMWETLENKTYPNNVKLFLGDALLSILPQAKFKDYRSKSQDLHVPERQLREVNLLNRFIDQVSLRSRRLREYSFSSDDGASPIACMDFRDFLAQLNNSSTSLLFTDPPWTDGNAYFEKAQLYHPWLGYELSSDADRLEKEFVVTDAPSRSAVHDMNRWWKDLDDLFAASSRVIQDLGYLAIYFRPIPAKQWLTNLNRLKLHARKAGFEPLLTIDAASKDPSMRIQQSASFVFSDDIIFVFLKLPRNIQRVFSGSTDVDYLVFKSASDLQELKGAPFTFREWQNRFTTLCLDNNVHDILVPSKQDQVVALFERYIREVTPGMYLVRPDTPFNGQLFDVPVQERLFAVVPSIVQDLTKEGSLFSYDQFLLRLSAYVENGTRMLIQSIESVDVARLLSPYAEPIEDGKLFRQKTIPALPVSVSKLMDLDPYEFEAFAAKLLEAQGCTQIALMGGSGDRGVDVSAIDSKGRSVVVQCKRYLNNVSADPIQRLHSFAVTRGVDRKIVITTAGFTPQALDEAARTDTELIDGSALELLVQTYLPDFLKDGNMLKL
ncbi:restriction endonuclease [Schaalia sp. lx-100]|uniref:restriction endonuclease n=1 Tax=Schaalia sp. lx-100 TaxID=2899081 RepID=UPI001E4CB283|nr:restriction endonuclease [Schaalia sp. lx-100]MCD4557329.1 restriction endonuclease [Schaalia sp. lx-100]